MHRRDYACHVWIPLVAGMAVTLVCWMVPQLAAAQYPAESIHPAPLHDVWDAQWITHPTASRTEFGVFHFRRTFDLDAPPDSFVIHVSADNRYRLFVNGTSVGTGPARGDLAHWRFETYDIAPHLRVGTNVIAAVVWNFADQRPMAQISHETAFLVQGNSEREALVNTNETWRVSESEAHAPVPVDRAALGYVYIVVGPGEQVDASMYPWGWTTAAYDDASWVTALELGQAVPRGAAPYGVQTGWLLVPRTIPMMEETPQRIPRLARANGIEPQEGFLNGTDDLTIDAHTSATLLLDQTHLTTGYPELEVSGGAGSTITLTYAEALFDDDGRKGNRDVIAGKQIVGLQDRFLPDGGDRRRFSTLWWRTWRYLQLDIETGNEPLTLHDVSGRFTAYPFREQARFASSDTTLSTIWNVGWRTARLCAGETYFDCPYYEQLQYVGDTRIQALISLYVAGDDRLMRKAIDGFNDSRIPEGLTASRYPSHEPQLIPPYSLLWIAMVHDYWMHHDDPAYVERLLTGIRGVVEWYEKHIDETGMLGPMPWWNFVDWSYPQGIPPGADDGHSAVVALQYIYVLDLAAELADAFGRTSDVLYYRRLEASLKEATYRLCWDVEQELLADTPAKEQFSQHANAMAVLVDLVPPNEQHALTQRVVSDTTLVPSTYYFRFYVHRAMRKAGLGDEFLGQLGPWRHMLEQGLTTFAEEPEPTRSDCHAWSASPNYEFLATVLGIVPAEPGFAAVRIEPHLGPLSWAEGRMPHPDGDIEVQLERRGEEGVVGAITLPEELTGTFVWRGQTIPLHGGQQRVEL